MKILHIDFTGTFNETMSYQENIIPYFHAKDGHEVIMLTTCFEWNENGQIVYTPPIDKIMNNGVRLIRMDYQKIINKYITSKIRKVHGVYKILEQISPEIIFIHCPQTYEINTIRNYCKRKNGIKVYVDNHTDYINSVPNWISKYILHKMIWRYYIKLLEPFVKKFYGVTPLRCDFLKQMYNIPEEKIELLVMGADNDKLNIKEKEIIRKNIRKELNIPESAFVLVTGGKIDSKKNIHLLIEAFNTIEDDILYLIVFGNPTLEMQSTILKLRNSVKIRYLSWIDSKQIYDLFLISDLAVFPGTHSVLWEQAVGSGIPCVFRYWKGMTHIDVGGNCKFIFQDKVEEIRDIIIEIISDKNLYTFMKKVANDEGIKKFSYEQISKAAIDR